MSFFVKACVAALKDFPAVNAGSTATTWSTSTSTTWASRSAAERGLVVPVVRDADQLSFAEIEKAIAASASGPRRHSSSWTKCTAAPSPSPMAASSAA